MQKMQRCIVKKEAYKRPGSCEPCQLRPPASENGYNIKEGNLNPKGYIKPKGISL
jgi:hypothetical protein